MSTFVSLFHILVVGSLFIYLGIKKTNIPSVMFPILLGLGIVIILYHLYKVKIHLDSSSKYWYNLIHIFFIGPLLSYIGYMKKDSYPVAFELILLFGFAAIGYHIFYMIK